MEDRTRVFTAMCAAFLVCAIAVTLLAWRVLPPHSVPLSAVVWFTLFAAVTEMLGVNTTQQTGSTILPSAAFHWAAPCLFGPVPAILCCVASASFGQLVVAVACYASRAISDRRSNHLSKAAQSPFIERFWSSLEIALSTLGQNLRVYEFTAWLKSIVLFTSTLIIAAGLSGLAYRALGGQLLIYGAPQSIIANFILPFLGLVVVSVVIEHGEYVIAMVVVDPVAGAKGWYRVILRAKLALVEDIVPVWRGELFLIIVSVLMVHLFSRIGVIGLVLALMPVLALRDFFHQWVKTKEAYLDTITTLATYMQHYHPYTRGHLKRVAELSERLARELRLPVDSIRYISTAGFLHDIGKVGVSEEILDKTGKLTDEEWQCIREHPVKGAEIVSHIELLEGIVDWIKYHHKWYNGAGYPPGDGNGGGIPIEAAIIAAADAFDAMTDDRELSLEWKCDSCGYATGDGCRPVRCPKCGAQKHRTYREPLSLDQAIDELRRGAGTQFDPRVVKALLTMIDREGIRLNAR